MKLEKKQIEKLVLTLIGVVIVIIVLVSLVFGPNIKRIGSLRANIREQKSKVLNAEQEVADLERTRLNLKKMQEEFTEYENEFPEASAYWLLGKLNQLAEETGINFDRTEPKGYIMQIGEYYLQALQLDLRTGYHKLGRFINQLEKSSRFLRILNLSIIGNKEDAGRHNVVLTIGVFVSKPKEEKE